MTATARRWIITGGSRGVGLATAKLALERGDKVAVIARGLDPVAMRKELGRNALAFKADVSDATSVASVATAVVDAWGGVDVVEFCRDYLDLIKTMHIKDIDPNVLEVGRAAGWDYRTFSDKGIFIELGRGFVDFPAVFELLDSINFASWLIVETDVTQQPTALESAIISREYLKSIGL